MDTVILALDGKESERALPAATELAKQSMARIVIVHVNQLIAAARGGRIPTHPDETKRQARLHEIVAQLKADGYDTELEIHTPALGHPANIITDAATRHNADAIVLATRGHIPAIGLLASSVTQRLLHQAPCPVLAHHTPHHPQTTPHTQPHHHSSRVTTSPTTMPQREWDAVTDSTTLTKSWTGGRTGLLNGDGHPPSSGYCRVALGCHTQPVQPLTHRITPDALCRRRHDAVRGTSRVGETLGRVSSVGR